VRHPAIASWPYLFKNGINLEVKTLGKVRNNLPFLKELAYEYFTQKLDSAAKYGMFKEIDLIEKVVELHNKKISPHK